ncbi:hypothetical protein IY145_21440 [Methylosinus sp. H3A]|uniref:hypothetical protein n=1 Tax=Methylosinus sp. H3A TaxID=2785786 RepID=UPI0018C240CB|nr:hypothetical protein [Methylosinus sp. H3A]MBG0811916.1 hypothetical protein [Methylosinus sp. H3A]
MDIPPFDPAIAAGVALSTAVTDAVYVFFNAAVSERRRVAAASWSSVWYLLSAFAVISYTSNWAYVLFAALGAWIGGFLSITALNRVAPPRGALSPERKDRNE